MEEKLIGQISGYFTKIGVAAIDLEGPLKVGDKIHIKGHTTDLTEDVKSMQIDRKEVQEAKKGESIGIKVSDRVRPGDKVYKA